MTRLYQLKLLLKTSLRSQFFSLSSLSTGTTDQQGSVWLNANQIDSGSTGETERFFFI